jgi:DNA-binding response OmpR family regulator
MILDIGLPDMDGFDVLHHIRKIQRNNFPVLMLTARDAILIASKALKWEQMIISSNLFRRWN